MDLPKVATDGWRLPKKGPMSDRIPDSAYAKVGLPVVSTKTSSGDDTERVGTVIDMTEWVLPKNESKKMRVNVVGKKLSKRAKATDASSEGEPMLYGGMPTRRAILPEDLKHELRRLAGLERSAHIEFATGKPYRRMPDERIPIELIGEGSNAALIRDAKKSIRVRLQGMSAGTPTEADLVKALDRNFSATVVQTALRDLLAVKQVVSSGGKLSWSGTKGKFGPYQDLIIKSLKAVGGSVSTTKLDDFATKKWGFKEYDKAMRALQDRKIVTRTTIAPEAGKYVLNLPDAGVAESAFRLPEEQQLLAGLTTRNPLPKPGGFVQSTPRSAGILDPVTESEGEAYVQKILQESNWFFRDFNGLSLGVVSPLGEAPAGRQGPWRGSHADEPDEEPGDDEEPEDEEPPKQQRKRQGFGAQAAKSEPEDDEEPEDDDEETESVDEAEGGGPSHGAQALRHMGGAIQNLGHRISGGGQSLGNVHQRLRNLATKHADKVKAAKQAQAKSKPAMPGAAKPVATAK